MSETVDPRAPAAAAKPSPREIPELIDRLGSVAAATHAAAADALAQLGADAAPALRWALRDFDYSLRSRAAEVLARIGEPAIPMLQDAVRDHDVEVRIWAVWALGRIGGAAAVEALIAVPRDADVRVRRLWARTLAEMHGVFTELSANSLERAVEDLDAPVAVPALYAISKRRSEESVRVLTAALKNLDLDVRFTAVYCLQRVGADVPFTAIEAILRAGSQSQRKQAIGLLRHYPASQAFPRLEALALDRDYEIATAAAAALGESGKSAAEPLCRLLWSPELLRHEYVENGEPRWSRGSVSRREQLIADALCRLGTDAIPVLYEHLSRGPNESSDKGWRVVERLTECQPCPELRCLLPLFPRYTSPLALLLPDHRQHLIDLRMQIEWATAQWKSLPVTAAAPAESVDALPLPASPASPGALVLPLPLRDGPPDAREIAPDSTRNGMGAPPTRPERGFGGWARAWCEQLLGRDA